MTEDLKTYRRFNAGFFDNCHRPLEGSQPELVGQEIIIAEEIQSRLSTEEQVNVVGLGEMAALSIRAVATHFKEEIATGRLRIIATNVEPIGEEELTQEAARRLGVYGSEEGWARAQQDVWNPSDRTDWENMFNEKPLVPDRQALAFMQKTSGLVEYMGGVDTTSLPVVLGQHTVDIVAEHFGGLFHHTTRQDAVKAVAETLKDGGVLVTTETFEGDRSYGDTQSIGLMPEGNYEWGTGGYRAYRRAVK